MANHDMMMDTEQFCPFSWGISGNELDRMKETLNQWSPATDARENNAWKILLAYLSFDTEGELEIAQCLLEEVLSDDPDNIVALASSAHIHRHLGEIIESRQLDNRIKQLTDDPRVLDKVLHVKAFALMHAGPTGVTMAQPILEELHERNCEDGVILLDLIRCLHRQIHAKTNPNISNKELYESQIDKLFTCIIRASQLMQSYRNFYCEVLHAYNAARTTDTGKRYTAAFVKEYPHLSTERCIQQARQFPYNDARDLYLFSGLFSHYRHERQYKMLHGVANEAMEMFPGHRKTQMLVLRGIFTTTVNEFNKHGRASTLFQILANQFTEKAAEFVRGHQRWWFSCRISRQIGQVYYLKGDTKNGFKWMKTALDFCKQNYGTKQDLVVTHVIWCYCIVWSDLPKARNLCFVHMRKALSFGDCYFEQVVSSLKNLFQSAIKNKPENTFFVLCLAYLELEQQNYEAAEKLFRMVTNISSGMDSTLGVAECLLATAHPTEAQDWINKGRQLSMVHEDREQYQQTIKMLQDQLVTMAQCVNHGSTGSEERETTPCRLQAASEDGYLVQDSEQYDSQEIEDSMFAVPMEDTSDNEDHDAYMQEHTDVSLDIIEGLRKLVLDTEKMVLLEHGATVNVPQQGDFMIQVFQEVSRMIRLKDWRRLGRELEIDDSDYIESVLDEIELKHKMKLVDRVLEILNKWRARYREKATVETLTKILENCNCKNIAEKIQKMFNPQQ